MAVVHVDHRMGQMTRLLFITRPTCGINGIDPLLSIRAYTFKPWHKHQKRDVINEKNYVLSKIARPFLKCYTSYSVL
jgi:hypothetical protein